MMGRFASVQGAHLGLESIDEGVLRLSGGRYRAVLEVGSVNFALQGERRAGGHRGRLRRLPERSVLPGADPHAGPAHRPRGLPGELERRALQFPEDLADLARDHVAFLRRLARSRTLLERRFYLVVPAQEGPRPTAHSRGWPFGRKISDLDAEAARKQLTFRCEEVERQLARCGLAARRLSSVELAQLLYDCWCPELARIQRVRRDLAEYTALVVKG